MVEKKVVKSVQAYLVALQKSGLQVSFGVIFGSHATGNSDEWSDIDLLVVSPRFDENYQRSEVNLLWRTAARLDSRIEPIPVGVRQYRENDSSSILEIARRHGLEVVPLAD